MTLERNFRDEKNIFKNSVIFIIREGTFIQLEKRVQPSDRYYGYTLIPGGKCDEGECPQNALIREVREEFGINSITAEELGLLEVPEGSGIVSCKHVFVVDSWKNTLSNPENRNIHLTVPIDEARKICTHPVSQKVLDLLDKYLLRQNC